MFIKTMVWLNGYDEVDPHAKYINIDWVTVIEPMVKGGLEISLINSHEDDASFYVVPPEYAPAFLEALAKAEGVIDAAVKSEPEADDEPDDDDGIPDYVIAALVKLPASRLHYKDTFGSLEQLGEFDAIAWLCEFDERYDKAIQVAIEKQNAPEINESEAQS